MAAWGLPREKFLQFPGVTLGTSPPLTEVCRAARALCQVSKVGALLFGQRFWEPPDVGLASTGVWRVPPSPIAIGGPFPQANPLPSLPSPSFFPPHPLGSFGKAPGGGGSGWWGGGVLGRRGVEGGALQAALGARPTSGGTRRLRGGAKRIA